MKNNQSSFILFKTEDEKISVDVRFEEDSVWLSQEQMAILFERDRTVIVKHIANIFSEGELEEKSNVQFLHIANSDKPVKFYNLNVIPEIVEQIIIILNFPAAFIHQYVLLQIIRETKFLQAVAN
jgi:hypothetical protein